MKADYHVHSNFSDGTSTPSEIINKAITLNMNSIGFSDHSYAPYDSDCCIPAFRIQEYIDCIHKLKDEYNKIIDVYCGIEQDYYSTEPTDPYDYVIGSVHYLKIGDSYYTVDYLPDTILNAARYHFKGDIYSLVEYYYDTVSDVVSKTGCNVIGHFDLIAKLNDRYDLFDESNPRYENAWKRAADELITYGVPFEINTGAISRGFRKEAYPATPIMQYLIQKGSAFILSSDSHNPNTLCYGFDEYIRKASSLQIRILEQIPAGKIR